MGWLGSGSFNQLKKTASFFLLLIKFFYIMAVIFFTAIYYCYNRLRCRVGNNYILSRQRNWIRTYIFV